MTGEALAVPPGPLAETKLVDELDVAQHAEAHRRKEREGINIASDRTHRKCLLTTLAAIRHHAPDQMPADPLALCAGGQPRRVPVAASRRE
jgi:hypothetical protein